MNYLCKSPEVIKKVTWNIIFSTGICQRICEFDIGCLFLLPWYLSLVSSYKVNYKMNSYNKFIDTQLSSIYKKIYRIY